MAGVGFETDGTDQALTLLAIRNFLHVLLAVYSSIGIIPHVHSVAPSRCASFVRYSTLLRHSLSALQILKTRAPMVGCRSIHADREPHEFLVTFMEGGRPSPPCGASDGFTKGLFKVCSYAVYTRTPRDVHSIRDLDPDARVWDSWSRFQFTQIQGFVSVLPCTSSASLASMYAVVFWYGSVLGALSIGRKSQVLTYKPGSSSRIRRMIVRIGRVPFFPSG